MATRREIRAKAEAELRGAIFHRSGAVDFTRLAPPEGADGPTLYECSIASEEPVDRWFGVEAFDLSRNENVDMAWANAGGAVLLNHDTNDQIGVIERCWVDPEKKQIRAVFRFSRNAHPQEIERDWNDGIRRNVSIGYQVLDYDLAKGEKGSPDYYTVTRLMPLEMSIVAVPADITIGQGRAFESIEEVEPGEVATAAPETAPRGAQEERAMSESETITVTEPTPASPNVDEIRKQVAQELLETVRTMPKGSIAAEALVEHDKKPAPEYSYLRVMRAMAGMEKFDGYEKEMHEELSRGLPPHLTQGGIRIPTRTQKRVSALVTNVTTYGAEHIFTQQGEFVDLLRNESKVLTAGARMLTNLRGPVSFPKLTAGATFYWMAENSGTDATASPPTTGLTTLIPKQLIANVPVSRQFLAESGVDGEAMVRSDLAKGYGIAIDRAAIHGLGTTNEPCGVYLQIGVQSQTITTVPTYANLSGMYGKLALYNALDDSCTLLTTPQMAALMAVTLPASSVGSNWIWQGKIGDGTVAGYRAMSTAQVSAVMSGTAPTGGSNHGIVVGNWKYMVIGDYGMELVLDTATMAAQGCVRYVAIGMADIVLLHPEAFCVSSAATIS